MQALRTPTITKKYAELLRQGKRDDYYRELTREGFVWWFNMDIPGLASHLQALPGPLAPGDAPLRLVLLGRLIEADLNEPALADLYASCLAAGDWEAACAAAGAGTAAVWDSGHDFRRFQPWLARIDALLADAPEDIPLARASLLGFKANAQMNGQGDLAGSAATCHLQLLAAEEARSPSLCVFHAALQTYCHLWQGSLTSAGLILEDAEYLCDQGGAALIPQVFLRSSRGLYHTINAEPEIGRGILEALVAQPWIEQLPSSLWLLVQANLLFAIANCEDRSSLSAVAERICRCAVPRQNAFHHSYAHFSRGVAALGLGQPRQALAHAQQAIDHGVAARSAVTERMPVLLKGQALADLGLDEEALSLFEDWMPTWQASGFCTVAASAAQEAARIFLGRGELEQARAWQARAEAAVPEGETPPLFHRPPRIAEELRAGLSGMSVRGLVPRPIQIRCLGDFRVELGGQVLHDRKWRGGRTMTLLKALIVLGGEDIAVGHLTDWLWPDAEGDQAYGNLKVLIWRLRHLGLDKGQTPLPWLQLRKGHLSLAGDLCSVDALCFMKGLKAALRRSDRNWAGIKDALDLYSGDFLPMDCSTNWIIAYREQLRRQYLEGVLTLSSSAGNPAQREESLVYLQRALEFDILDERIYLQLMQYYLRDGYPAKALEVYHAAQSALERGLGIDPGPALVELARRAGGHAQE